jgi:hypothetical protein
MYYNTLHFNKYLYEYADLLIQTSSWPPIYILHVQVLNLSTYESAL